MKFPSGSFCVLPFGHLFLSEEGKSFPCCYALETGAVNRGEDGEPLLVRDEESLLAAWNGKDMREIRRAMLAGEQPAACARCFQLERHGIRSLRQISNGRFGGEVERLVANADPGGSQPLELFSLDLRLGNHCNLRCQMCSPVSSRKMIEEFKLLYPGSEPDFAHLERMDWQTSDSLKGVVLSHAELLREAHFAGGEPFLIPEVAGYVEALAASGHGGKIRLSFNTNGTVLPEALLEKFHLFEGVRLILSVDGLGPVNDYIRFPSRFERIEANLQRIHENLKAWNLTHVCFNVTVQAHNLFQLPDLVRYLTRRFPGFLPYPVLTPLRFPECLSIQVLPREVKERAREELLRLIREEEPYWKSIEHREQFPEAAKNFRGQVEGMIGFMMEDDRQELLPEFRRFTKVLEQKRGKAPDIPGLEAG